MRRAILLAMLTAALAADAAGAAPPPNDAPAGAAPFEAYTAANGRPREQQAVAELAEATADPVVPRCLGRRSFARTAWYRVPAAPEVREVAVEAIGRTLDVLDLAAFVQPAGATAPVTATPNACAGAGAGGSAAAEESTAGIVLRVPAGRDVLVQVGRRGAPGPAEDERALLALDARPLAFAAPPAGDSAGAATPLLRAKRTSLVEMAGSTVGDEDPAQPACPSPSTVWRRIVPGTRGHRLVSATGRAVTSLAVFSGSRPTAAGALDCVVRSTNGPLQMRVPARRGRTLWIRLGTATRAGSAIAGVSVAPAGRERVVDGGAGGFDPTPGGPGGGLPAACDRARGSVARIAGRITRLRPGVRVRLRARRSAVCDVRLRLIGPRGHEYATGYARRLAGRRTLRLRKVRRLVPGRYALAVDAASELGGRTDVPTRVRGRLR